MYIHTHTYIYIHIHTYIYIHIQIYIQYIHMHTYIHICLEVPIIFEIYREGLFTHCGKGEYGDIVGAQIGRDAICGVQFFHIQVLKV